MLSQGRICIYWCAKFFSFILSGMAFTQQLKDIDEMMEYNNLSYSDIMEMLPFDFVLLRNMFIAKVKKRQQE